MIKTCVHTDGYSKEFPIWNATVMSNLNVESGLMKVAAPLDEFRWKNSLILSINNGSMDDLASVF